MHANDTEIGLQKIVKTLKMFVDDRGNILDEVSHKYNISAMTYMHIKCTGWKILV
jgi:hypothetical protein